MSDAPEAGDKIHDPTPRKLEEARRKGEVARSNDLSAAAAYLGLLLALVVAGPAMVERLGTAMRGLIADADLWRPAVFGASAQAPIGGLFMSVATAVAGLFVTPAVLVVLVVVAQRAFLVTPSKLKMKLSRVSLIANAKNKFGRSGLFEFAKSFAKLLVLSAVMFFFLSARLEEMAATVVTGPAPAMILLARMGLEFLAVVTVVMLAIGGIDFLWQRAEHIRKNRMTHKELRDEMKESEGDPHMKQSRRQKAQEIAGRRMMQDVPSADVVIVNPTHYAVALRWDRRPGSAPVCVAKGCDEIARRIREIATESGVPIHSDPPTARALHATVEIGSEVPPTQYRAVAAAIRFADTLRRKRRR